MQVRPELILSVGLERRVQFLVGHPMEVADHPDGIGPSTHLGVHQKLRDGIGDTQVAVHPIDDPGP
ncbi:MAG: hypothetical protein R2789_12290 [Microthrixaceae bacterium]